MRTLADMTEEERANCPGMWATSFIGYTGVIMYQNGRQAYLIIPEYSREQTFPLDEVTPRPDLPRAWTPDGQPPAGEWEDDYTDQDGDTLTTGEHLGVGPHTHIRRFVSEWEEA